MVGLMIPYQDKKQQLKIQKSYLDKMLWTPCQARGVNKVRLKVGLLVVIKIIRQLLNKTLTLATGYSKVTSIL